MLPEGPQGKGQSKGKGRVKGKAQGQKKAKATGRGRGWVRGQDRVAAANDAVGDQGGVEAAAIPDDAAALEALAMAAGSMAQLGGPSNSSGGTGDIAAVLQQEASILGDVKGGCSRLQRRVGVVTRAVTSRATAAAEAADVLCQLANLQVCHHALGICPCTGFCNPHF